MLVAPAAPTALAQDEGLGLGLGHITDDLLGLRVPDNGTTGDTKGEIGAVAAGAALAAAVHAVGRHILALITEIHQGGHVVVDDYHHIAALTAVASVRAAGGHIFFPVEGNHAVAAVAGADSNTGGIYKRCCHSGPPLKIQ